jgi:lipopolysaccharide export LptBFGC system permease protein LptF
VLCGTSASAATANARNIDVFMPTPFAAGRLRILDRFVLGATWPALCAAVAPAALGWLVGGPIMGLSAGSFALAIGLAVAYGIMAREGEYAALQQAGIAPRRIGAAVVVCALALAAAAAAIACAWFRPAVRTGYAGYVLAALQLPLMASLALPVAVRSRAEEPWARMVVLLIGYAIAIVAVSAFGRGAGWAPGLEWFFIDVALLAADVALYRDATKPRAHV